jgi:hypothetical protein
MFSWSLLSGSSSACGEQTSSLGPGRYGGDQASLFRGSVTVRPADLKRLSDLVREHNAIGDQIAGVIGKPAERGHVGEYVAAQIFNITLERSARKRARDGRFTAGALAGRTANVKWYGMQEGVLDLHARGEPDYYLALTGPAGSAASSRGATRPWVIHSVYLFDARRLLEELRARR